VTSDITKNLPSAFSILRKINSHLSYKRKKELKTVLLLSIFASLAESLSIATLIPFVSFFINPESYLFNGFFKEAFIFFNISERRDILGLVSFLFIFIIFISGYLKLKHIKLTNLATENITSDFRIKIFGFLISQDYSYYFKHGSNEIMSNLSQKTGSFTSLVFSSINILNSILISTAIITVLILNEPFYTPIIIFSVILFFFIIFKIKSNIVLQKGQNINLNQNFLIDIFENTVGYLPEIIIYNSKKFYTKVLSKVSKEIARSVAETNTIAQVPRICLETFVIIFVILLIFFSGFSERSMEINISYLAILAFAAQKSLPLINNVYNLSINFKGATPIVLTFLDILESGKKVVPDDKDYVHLGFNKSIKLEKIYFKYENNLPEILKNLNLEIYKGENIAIKGETGSGKSTLTNIISGLLNPSSGKILVDGTEVNAENMKNWQKNISVVPQTIFLNDATVLENIAIGFSHSEIDIKRAEEAAKLAHIDNFIKELPNQYNEYVGERGVRLSGGQRQRIGIARAIYRNSKIIILDEPTNALDLETEKLVIDSITKLNKEITVIMISHTSNSLKYFDKIINLDDLK